MIREQEHRNLVVNHFEDLAEDLINNTVDDSQRLFGVLRCGYLVLRMAGIGEVPIVVADPVYFRDDQH